MKGLITPLNLILLLWIATCGLSAEESAFNNNHAEVAAGTYFETHEAWPKTIDDLVAVEKYHSFRREDYSAIEFKVLPSGALQMKLTAPSGKSEIRVCQKPSTDAVSIIKKEGYLIVDDGSSFYYLGGDGTFVSGPLDSWCGRAMEGTYSIEESTVFFARASMHYFNRPSELTPYQMGFEINSVSRDGVAFDRKNFAFLNDLPNGEKRKFPDKPVVHKAYFVFNSLVPMKK